MNDYTWPSVYFAYLFFAISLAVAVFFFIRSLKDGYWTKKGEEVKYQVFEDGPLAYARGSEPSHDRKGVVSDYQEQSHVTR
jgi:hypothetical protein